MSLAAPVSANLATSSATSLSLESVKRLLLGSAMRSRLALKSLTSHNFNNIDRALKSLVADKSKVKSPSATSSDLATLIRSFESFDSFLTGSIDEDLLPVDMPLSRLTAVEAQVYRVVARSIIYPESLHYLSLVKEINSQFTSGASFISTEEQEKAQEKCFKAKKLTIACLHEKALSKKIENILTTIGMNKARDFEHEEITEAILELISKGSSNKRIVAKRAFFYSGADHVLKNHSQLDLFTICIGHDKSFRYWQMESMTHCRAVWQRELGSLEMDAELEAVFFRQVTKFDAQVMRLVQGLSHEVLAPKMDCSKGDTGCLEEIIGARLQTWEPAGRFTPDQLESLKKSLARNLVM